MADSDRLYNWHIENLTLLIMAPESTEEDDAPSKGEEKKNGDTSEPLIVAVPQLMDSCKPEATTQQISDASTIAPSKADKGDESEY